MFLTEVLGEGSYCKESVCGLDNLCWGETSSRDPSEGYRARIARLATLKAGIYKGELSVFHIPA